LVEDKDVCA